MSQENIECSSNVAKSQSSLKHESSGWGTFDLLKSPPPPKHSSFCWHEIFLFSPRNSVYRESIDGRMPEEFPFTHILAVETFQSRSFFRKRTYFCIADGDKNQVPTFIVVSQAPPAITCLRQQNFLQFHFCIIASQISFGHESGQKLKVSTVSQNTKADVLYDMLQFEIYEVSFEFINPWKVKTRRPLLLPQPHFSNIDFLRKSLKIIDSFTILIRSQ